MTTPFSPEQDFVAFLTGTSVTLPSGPVTLTAGTNLFSGPVLPAVTGTGTAGVPAQAVFIQASGGPQPLPYMGEGQTFYKSNVQVRTRSNPRDDVNGRALARAIRALLHTASVPISGGPATYTQVLTLEAEPLFLGLDETGRSEFSQNFTAQSVQSP